MVHIFAGEEHHISNIKSLIVVLTSATLTIFQQGNKHLQLIQIYFQTCVYLVSSYIYFLQVHGIILILQNHLCTFMLRWVEYSRPLLRTSDCSAQKTLPDRFVFI